MKNKQLEKRQKQIINHQKKMKRKWKIRKTIIRNISKNNSDVNDIISNMNQSTEELKKLNTLFFIESSKKINKTNLQSQNLSKINNYQSINQETKDHQLIEENKKKK